LSLEEELSLNVDGDEAAPELLLTLVAPGAMLKPKREIGMPSKPRPGEPELSGSLHSPFPVLRRPVAKLPTLASAQKQASILASRSIVRAWTISLRVPNDHCHLGSFHGNGKDSEPALVTLGFDFRRLLLS
jgi:hypothetical protein